ncbi:hybrid sensor histidine kinase/response regulator [Anaerolineales bacterium HSG6]|nr:hybrid sensor histidine kinase/response regulator [Anaerolineales bacterium HSG6]MDM8532920.1 hybrid sensor histidine kinase/response regulator [Anaerolineales bacterium HSG25]
MTNKILVVEDEDMLQELVIYELDNEGYQTLGASDGQCALQIVDTNKDIDLILLDVQLPKLDGFEVAKRVKADKDTEHIPIIFLTARTTLTDKMTGFGVGGTDYLTKPFSMAELKARVKATIERGEIERRQAERNLKAYKEQLSQNMSHELLTPMAKILNSLDVIDNIAKQENLPQFDSSITIARSGAHQMRWLIEDLLTLNRVDNDSIMPFRQSVLLAPIITTLTEQLKNSYRHDALTIEVDMPAEQQVNINRRHLNHILYHLLDNACKFSPKRGIINVKVTSVGKMGVMIEVEDHGIGIESDYHEKIFGRFYQVDMSVTRPQDGLGVGLHIARVLAHLYNGDIILRSVHNRGTIVCFSLPDVSPEW